VSLPREEFQRPGKGRKKKEKENEEMYST